MRILVLAVAGLLFASLPGCMMVMMEVNRKPPTDRLETMLEVGRTNRGQVLEILGPPDGVGQAKLLFHPEPRILWHYVHSKGASDDLRQTLLWVFFDGDVYEGYLWYSTAEGEGLP